MTMRSRAGGPEATGSADLKTRVFPDKTLRYLAVTPDGKREMRTV